MRRPYVAAYNLPAPYFVDGLEFYWDETNGVWLSRDMTEHVVRGNSEQFTEAMNNCYLRSDANEGLQVTDAVAVVGMTASWVVTATTGNIRCRRDGSNIAALDLAVDGISNTQAENMGLYGAFAASGRLQVYIDGLSAPISYPTVSIWTRRSITP